MQTKTDTHHATTSQAVDPPAAVRDLLWPASRLGAQLHIGAEELSAAGFGWRLSFSPEPGTAQAQFLIGLR